MVDAVEAMAGAQPKEVSADAGYCSQDNLAGIEKRGVKGYVATGRHKHGATSATGRRAKRRGTRVAVMATITRRATGAAAQIDRPMTIRSAIRGSGLLITL
jgi:hypothetical protein